MEPCSYVALGGRSKLIFINQENGMPDPSSSAYSSWLSQDQLVISWLLNSIEPKVSEIFSYSTSSFDLWIAVKEMFGDMNNAARVFQLKKDLSDLRQSSRSFVQLLGLFKAKWNELDLYRLYTTDSTIILYRSEEDKMFQLLAALGPDYDDLKSHLIMSPKLPSLQTVCNTIQREEVHRRVMNHNATANVVEGGQPAEARAFLSNTQRPYRGRQPDLKCSHCEHIGHSGIGHQKDKCWILHPELKPKQQNGYKENNKALYTSKANMTSVGESSSSDKLVDFTTNPLNILNDFAAFLSKKQGDNGETKAMLGKFVSSQP
ncbi:conserved hypothetical protein [Ricinus communis]|uniref:Retrotransposon gag domain-containing protein n=1 Tax=Ricinus communis TaxID=3988 RepID=B9SW69_RICCO|nr:conserved hypothetical protein [Ricinus communis]